MPLISVLGIVGGGNSGVQGHSQLPPEFEAILVYTRLSQKNKTTYFFLSFTSKEEIQL